MGATRFPLSWPTGWKRTKNRQEARFSRKTHGVNQEGKRYTSGSRELSVSEATERAIRELNAMNARNILISTNLQLTTYGVPRSNQRAPEDPGVAIYWERNGKPQCMAIDQYDRVADNLAAVAVSLQGLRAVERHGGAQIMERAFIGFAQLPESTGRHWREVLGISGLPSVHIIETAFRELARERHPDYQSGSHIGMAELNAAREAALRELEGR